jgi:hypothetical protein
VARRRLAAAQELHGARREQRPARVRLPRAHPGPGPRTATKSATGPRREQSALPERSEAEVSPTPAGTEPKKASDAVARLGGAPAAEVGASRHGSARSAHSQDGYGRRGARAGDLRVARSRPPARREPGAPELRARLRRARRLPVSRGTTPSLRARALRAGSRARVPRVPPCGGRDPLERPRSTRNDSSLRSRARSRGRAPPCS